MWCELLTFLVKQTLRTETVEGRRVPPPGQTAKGVEPCRNNRTKVQPSLAAPRMTCTLPPFGSCLLPFRSHPSRQGRTRFRQNNLPVVACVPEKLAISLAKRNVMLVEGSSRTLARPKSLPSGATCSHLPTIVQYFRNYCAVLCSNHENQQISISRINSWELQTANALKHQHSCQKHKMTIAKVTSQNFKQYACRCDESGCLSCETEHTVRSQLHSNNCNVHLNPVTPVQGEKRADSANFYQKYTVHNCKSRPLHPNRKKQGKSPEHKHVNTNKANEWHNSTITIVFPSTL